MHSSVASLKIKTSDFTVTDKLLKSCSHASNKYKLYLMQKKAEKEKTDMGQKRKALQDELMAVKKKKTELESVANLLLDTANKKSQRSREEIGCSSYEGINYGVQCIPRKSRRSEGKKHSSQSKRNQEH